MPSREIGDLGSVTRRCRRLRSERCRCRAWPRRSGRSTLRGSNSLGFCARSGGWHRWEARRRSYVLLRTAYLMPLDDFLDRARRRFFDLAAVLVDDRQPVLRTEEEPCITRWVSGMRAVDFLIRWIDRVSPVGGCELVGAMAGADGDGQGVDLVFFTKSAASSDRSATGCGPSTSRRRRLPRRPCPVPGEQAAQLAFHGEAAHENAW